MVAMGEGIGVEVTRARAGTAVCLVKEEPFPSPEGVGDTAVQAARAMLMIPQKNICQQVRVFILASYSYQ